MTSPQAAAPGPGARAVGCGSGHGAAAPLDNTTKSASAFEVDLCTGEVFSEYDPTFKWQLQSVARLALPGHRVHVCMRHLRPDKNEVQVRQSRESLKAYYAGLLACGSVWVCPVCAPKIQAIRAAEVRSAIDAWVALGGSVVMPTQTVQHQRRDRLDDLLRGFTGALSRSKAGRKYQALKTRYGMAHSIRALEITDGSNGWHPHAHTILFLEQSADLDQLAGDMFPLWRSAVARAGLNEVSPLAFSVQDAAEVRTYVTKMGREYQWNAEHELVKAHSKRGRRGGLSPFDMLRQYLEGGDDGRLLARYAEYAYNFHGKRQLVWSNGSKLELLGTEGLSDQQLSDSLGECDPVLAYIQLDQWKIIRRNNLQGQVLQVVQEFGRDGLVHLLSEYR